MLHFAAQTLRTGLRTQFLNYVPRANLMLTSAGRLANQGRQQTSARQ